MRLQDYPAWVISNCKLWIGVIAPEEGKSCSRGWWLDDVLSLPICSFPASGGMTRDDRTNSLEVPPREEVKIEVGKGQEAVKEEEADDLETGGQTSPPSR